MNDGLNWDRYGLIADLAVELKAKNSPQFGKTVLQKLVFLLQEVFGVDMEYSFGFHTYGPFAAELLSDLDLAQCIGAVQVEPVRPDEGSGYRIEPGPAAETARSRACGFLTEHREAINKLVGSFGGKSAKELELLTTIIYLNKEVQSLGSSTPESEAIRWIRELKPRFSETDVRAAISDLRAKHGIVLSFAA